MKINQLRKDRTEYPRCEAVLALQTRQFWYGRGRSGNEEGTDTCGNYASYKIGKKHFCRKHAGLYILDHYSEVVK